MRVQLELRNLPRARIMAYLVEAGGVTTDLQSVTGSGWSATLQPLPPAQVGSIRVPRDLLVIEGAEQRVRPIHAFMRQKTMRGGG